MACTITLAGIGNECKDNIGGIKEVYIIDYANVTGVTATADKISAITVDSTETFKTYSFKKQTSQMTTNIASDDVAGTTLFTTELNLRFSKLETAKRLEILALAFGDLAVIVRDSNDVFWYLGKNYPVSLSAGSINTGTNLGDFSGYDVTLTDIAKEAPMEVDKTALESILDGNQYPIV